MTDKERIAKLEKQVAALKQRLDTIVDLYCKRMYLQPPGDINARALDRFAEDLEKLNIREASKGNGKTRNHT